MLSDTSTFLQRAQTLMLFYKSKKICFGPRYNVRYAHWIYLFVYFATFQFFSCTFSHFSSFFPEFSTIVVYNPFVTPHSLVLCCYPHRRKRCDSRVKWRRWAMTRSGASSGTVPSSRSSFTFSIIFILRVIGQIFKRSESFLLHDETDNNLTTFCCTLSESESAIKT